MTNGTSALSLDEKTAGGLVPHPDPAARRGEWSFEQHLRIVEALKAYGCEYLNGREEYTLLKEIVTPDSVTEVTDSGKSRMARKPLNIRAEGSGVISPICVASSRNDTTEKVRYRKPFLAPMDLQKAGSIAQVIPSFRVIQSDSICLNIGFDTEFQDSRDGSDGNRRVLSLQMSVALGDTLIRYFFLVTPRYQEIGAEGGLIPLKYCLADILADLKKNHFPDLPLVLKRELIYKEKPRKNHEPFRTVDFAAMRDKVIPVTLICHTAEEFLNYRSTMQSEDCVKVKKDLERVRVKSTTKTKGYIGRDLDKKILMSILMGYRSGLYHIPALDGLKQAQIVEVVNSWGIAAISINDWKNCSRTKRHDNMLSREEVEATLRRILDSS